VRIATLAALALLATHIPAAAEQAVPAGGPATSQLHPAPSPPGMPGAPAVQEQPAARPEFPRTAIVEGGSAVRIGDVTVDPKRREVSFPASVNMREGLLEYALVGDTGKRHESLLMSAVEPYHLQVALLLLGLSAGRPLEFQGDPRRPEGDGVRIVVHWEEAGAPKSARLESLILNKRSGTPMEDTDWVFTGSKVSNGVFLAQAERSMIAVFRDPVALIDNPLQEGADDTIWFVNTDRTPPVGTPVTVRIQPARGTPPAPPVPPLSEKPIP